MAEDQRYLFEQNKNRINAGIATLEQEIDQINKELAAISKKILNLKGLIKKIAKNVAGVSIPGTDNETKKIGDNIKKIRALTSSVVRKISVLLIEVRSLSQIAKEDADLALEIEEYIQSTTAKLESIRKSTGPFVSRAINLYKKYVEILQLIKRVKAIGYAVKLLGSPAGIIIIVIFLGVSLVVLMFASTVNSMKEQPIESIASIFLRCGLDPSNECAAELLAEKTGESFSQRSQTE